MIVVRVALVIAALVLSPLSRAQVPILVTVVEFHHAGLDHYFLTPLGTEIAALDSGRQPGWARTGRSFAAWPVFPPTVPAANPVCRYYIPPDRGSSHFFSASAVECADVQAKIPTQPAFFGYLLETPNAFYIGLPDPVSGACVAGTVPVYRLWNQRPDSNHRYTTDRALRDQMVGQGYKAEGYGPDGVAMCAPSIGADSVLRVSDTSPFAPFCSAPGGLVYTHSEVEPYLAINPTNPDNLIGVWQQDRLSTGAAQGNLTGISFDGGRTWEKRQVPFSRCSGGNAGNGGDYPRATDPWVTFSPNGVAFQSALSTGGGVLEPGSSSAINVSRSTDGGRTWSSPIALIADGDEFFNDKEAIAADPTDARYVFASWDRLPRDGGGPAYFARTTDGGISWEAARPIHDPGPESQTINNIPIVLPSDGTLINFFTRIDVVDEQNVSTMQLMRSADKGATWMGPVTIHAQQAIGTRDPENGTAVRDGTLIASIAASRAGQLALVWQDARFSGGMRDAIAFSRSLDGGLTWSTPVRVSRDPLVQAFIPTVALRDDGTIGVTYYDFRSNTAARSTLMTDYWLAQSIDGVTWRESRVAGPFDLSLAPFSRGLFIGDYMSLGVRGDAFVPFFGIAHDGNTANRSDIAIGFITSPGVAPQTGVAKREASAADDPMMYRAEAMGAMPRTAHFAAKSDTAIREAMQRRVPGWRSPSEVRSATQ